MHSRMARSVPVVLLLSSLTALVGCNDTSKCDPSRDANCSTTSGRGGSGGAFVSSSSGTSKTSGSSPAGTTGESGSGTAARGGFGSTAHGVGGGE